MSVKITVTANLEKTFFFTSDVKNLTLRIIIEYNNDQI